MKKGVKSFSGVSTYFLWEIRVRRSGYEAEEISKKGHSKISEIKSTKKFGPRKRQCAVWQMAPSRCAVVQKRLGSTALQESICRHEFFNTLKSVKVFCLYLLKALILMLLWRWAFDPLYQWRAPQHLSRDLRQASRSDTVAPILARQMNGLPRFPSDMQMVSGVNWGKENHSSFVTRQVFYHVLFIHHFYVEGNLIILKITLHSA